VRYSVDCYCALPRNQTEDVREDCCEDDGLVIGNVSKERFRRSSI
jgi:hypothetical protein